MSLDVAAHRTTIEVIEAALEVPAGAEFAVKLKVTCAEGCGLHGLPMRITNPDGTSVNRPPTAHTAPEAAAEIALRAPREVGEHTWDIVVPAHEYNGAQHQQSSVALRVASKPHGTSLAVWDIPSPVVTGQPFRIKAGAKSSSGCELKGSAIEVCDEAGTVVARGQLGDAPWPGTAALYWTGLDLLAPAEESLIRWSVRFAAAGLELPHQGTSAQFSAAIVPPPEHRLTVKVLEKDTGTPIADAQVRLGAYGAATDASGHAEVELPKGRYELSVWKVEYDVRTQTVAIDTDMRIDVEAVPLPDDDPYAHWKM